MFSDKVGETVGHILVYVGINWEYSMKFRFWKMKARQEVSDCYGETCCRNLFLKKVFKHVEHALKHV